MKKELGKLMQLAGTPQFKPALNKAYKKYRENPEAQRILSELLAKELNATSDKLNMLEKEIDIKLQMQQISEIVSVAYIAKNYFNKSRHWLYQRINNSVVSGKPQQLKEDELKTLRFALKDISKKIGSLSV